MRFQMLSFVVIVTCLYLTMAQSYYDDCCLNYSPEIKHKYKKLVVKYRIQETEGGCNKPAIVFTLRKGRLFCADPKQQWVQDLMQRINKKKAYSITKVQKEFISAYFNLNVS